MWLTKSNFYKGIKIIDMISNKIKQLTAFIKLQMDWLRSNNEQEEIKKLQVILLAYYKMIFQFLFYLLLKKY